MKLAEILIDSINRDHIDLFIDAHKIKLVNDGYDEIEIRKIMFQCVESDIKKGSFVFHKFDFDSRDNKPYTISVDYLKKVSEIKSFVLESFIKNQKNLCITHYCSIVAENKNNYLVKYNNKNNIMKTLLPKRFVLPISIEKQFKIDKEKIEKLRYELEEFKSHFNNLYNI